LTTWKLIVAILTVIAGASLLLWRLLKARRPAAPAGGAAPGSDAPFLAKEATQRLSASSRPPLSKLPLVLMVGDSGSTKTTLMVNSGLDQELLAGQDHQQNLGPVPPTACANFWLAGGTVFVEAGGPLLANPGGVTELAASLRAANATSLVGSSAQKPRALVLCVDIGDFLKPDANAATAASAKRMRAVIGEVAKVWSSRMPLYVLFTKMDQVKYFADYVRNLSFDEAGRVFGFTLPLASSLQPGIYNQEQTTRLTQAFDELQDVYIDSRVELLRRENEPSLTPNTFEFPREFRKLRDDMIRYLVEVGRPSQLQATPFLRGFFFTGARPVTMGGESGARRVPQWVFLRGFFTQALLADRMAFQAASTNMGAGAIRNWLLGAAAALSLLWLGGATISFFNNRSLLQDAREAATAAAALPPASLESLKQVENLRLPASAVSDHMVAGAPMFHRWGVYPGESMQQAIRQTYCREVQRSLLTETRQLLARRLDTLPGAPGPTDDYDAPYGDLKAYLMLTSNPDKSDAKFLAQLLTDRWSAARGGTATPEMIRLARAQFQFLGAQLPSGLCAGRAEVATVAHARNYLNGFKLVDRAYRSMLDEVNRQGPPIRFTDPTNAMSDPREVGFAFSKDGFGMMKSAMGKALEYLDREQWVLGKNTSQVSPESLLADLGARYQADFVGQWNAFVDAATVHRYAGLKDAAGKLSSLASSTSPMVKLFCLVSVHTQVENPSISEVFKPFHGFAAPASCSTALIGGGNQQYMQGLVGLQIGVDRIANAPNPDNERLTEGDAAKAAAMTTAQTLNLGMKPAQLLKDPILYAEALLKGVPAGAANSKGAGFCAEIRPLLGKYPFNTAATAEAQPGELGAVFAPTTGRLFTFQQEALQPFISPSVGGGFIAKMDSPVPVNPGFVSFFNRAAGLSRLFFGNGPQIRVQFSLQVAPSPDLESVTLQIGSKTLRAGSGGGRQDFVWPDDAMSVRLQARGKDVAPPPAEFSGTWAVTRFLAAADESSSTGSQGSAVFRLKNTASIGRSSTTKSEVPLRINIDMKGAPMTLLPRDLQLGCVSTIAR
jgi:type VI secretion system protein ImpL